MKEGRFSVNSLAALGNYKLLKHIKANVLSPTSPVWISLRANFPLPCTNEDATTATPNPWFVTLSINNHATFHMTVWSTKCLPLLAAPASGSTCFTGCISIQLRAELFHGGFCYADVLTLEQLPATEKHKLNIYHIYIKNTALDGWMLTVSCCLSHILELNIRP